MIASNSMDRPNKRTRIIAIALITAAYVLMHYPYAGHADRSRYLRKTVRIGDIERSYGLYIPKDHTAAERGRPLVIVLHGARGSGLLVSEYAGFNDFADSKKFFVLYPDAFGEFWNDGRVDLNSPAFKANIDDVRFISTLIDEMLSRYGLDRERVYAAGFSNGGMMAFRLAIAISGKLAAAASVAGALPKQLAQASPAAAVPVLIINGTDDRTVPWRGGRLVSEGKNHGEVLSVINTTVYWAVKNGCGTGASVRILQTAGKENGSLAFQVSYACNKPESEVVLVALQGGSHSWPGLMNLPAVGNSIGSTGIFRATEFIVDFFARHRRR